MLIQALSGILQKPFISLRFVPSQIKSIFCLHWYVVYWVGNVMFCYVMHN